MFSRKEKDDVHTAYLNNFKSADKRDVTTTKDKQFNLTIDLHEDVERLTDVMALLRQCIATMSDKQATTIDKAASRNLANHTILPALEHMLTHMHAAALKLAPISSTGYVQQRHATAQKRAVNATMKESGDDIEVALLKEYVKKHDERGKLNQTTSITPTKVTTRLARNKKVKNKSKGKKTAEKKSPVVVTPPKPKNGSVYTKSEFCSIMMSYAERSEAKTAMIDAMIECNYVNNYHKQSLNRLLRQYQNFQAGETFRNDELAAGPGKPPILSTKELDECLEQFKDHNGQVMSEKKMEEVLVASKRRRLEEAGYCAVPQQCGVSDRTTANYIALAAGVDGIHIANSAISKTSARYATEASFRAVFNNVILILYTHFVEVPEEDLDIRRMAKDLSPSERKMYDLASQVRGGVAVRPIDAMCKVNFDDKVLYANARTDGAPTGVLLCSTASLKKRKHSSLSEVRDENIMNGIRTKIHANLNGEGASARQCLTFSLNEREMPDDDMIVLELEGLCVGGPTCNDIGYVIFLKKAPGAELKRYKFIQQNVHLPFIEQKCRSKLFKDCPVISSCDGDVSQLKCITEKEMIDVYNKKNIIAVKHNASNTGCEQSCDKGRVFPTIEQEYSRLTLADLPGSGDTMKKIIDDFFQENIKRINLTARRRNAITDVLCTYPGVATAAFTKKNAQEGFFLNANIDVTHKLFPVLDGILGTCKRLIPKEVLDIFMNNIQPLFDVMQKQGHIPDVMWDEIGIPEDVGPNGEVFKRGAGIEQECQQRGKVLNHAHQQKLREKRREEIDAAKREKDQRAANKVLEKINGDAATVQKLLDLLKGRDDSVEQILANCTVEDFFSLRVGQLRNFILHRSTDGKYNRVKDVEAIKKGKLEDAKAEVATEGSDSDHLVSIAYKLRNNKCKLEDIHLPEQGESDTSSTTCTHGATVIRVAMDPTANWKSSADILRNHVWVDSIGRIFNSSDTQTFIEVDDDAKERAASLSHALLCRFEAHVKKRVKAEYKRDHAILKWFRRNIPAFACYMVLLNHVKKNPASLRDTDCLLTTSMNNFLLINSNNRNLWGAYLVYDSSEEKFIRSGKCTGRGMEERWEEHHKNARSDINTADSQFVGTYPSKQSARASTSNGRFFEDLYQYVAAGFKPVETSYELFQRDYDDGGLFSWTSAEKELVCRTNIGGTRDNNLLKFAAVAGYGFELCYDLAISSRDNVSESPGFESFGLMLGGCD